MSTPKPKDLSIETLRGIAILLVVAGYIIHDDLTRAAYSSMDASLLRFAYFMMLPIRIPLFTVISAYLYASSPATRATFGKLIKGKAQRILVPFVTVSAIQHIVLALIPLSKSPLRDFYWIYVYPHEQFWFLMSIFQIFVLVGALDALRALDTPKKWFLCLLVTLIMQFLTEVTAAFSLKGTVYLLPFFMLGYGISRYPAALFRRHSLFAAGLLAAGSCALWASLYFDPKWPMLFKTAGLLVTFSVVPLIFYYKRTVPFLARVGYFAFGIFLFNRIAIAVPRALFEIMGYHNTLLLFVIYLFIGVFFAIAIQGVMERASFTRKYILGLKS